MPRIRYIKPEFFNDEDIAALPLLCRIFFAGLWTQADREGRLEDRPRYLKAAILPYDDCDAEELLNVLSQQKERTQIPFILRYEGNGRKYIQILNFLKHQKPHATEKDSEIPPPNGDLTVNSVVSNGAKMHGDGEGNGELKGKGTESIAPAVFENTLKIWNEQAALKGWRRSKGFNAKMKDHLRERLQENKNFLKDFEKAFAWLDTKFHRGENDRGWRANLEWALRQDKVKEILEDMESPRKREEDAWQI